jgi:hypothetical protein
MPELRLVRLRGRLEDQLLTLVPRAGMPCGHCEIRQKLDLPQVSPEEAFRRSFGSSYGVYRTGLQGESLFPNRGIDIFLDIKYLDIK